ncbi:hypothetical protein D623_10031156 [Myotis brandtii]|uniref:Uncharacterized protein n=1 Tax=Myotis brandtii TaxID=109478 RepID=S7PWZ4_MYOBR|nr:hypothetical protein D623_10031156 [Myotis brandtii]
MDVHGRWCRACTELPEPASTTLDPLSELLAVARAGKVHIAQRRVCVTQRSDYLGVVGEDSRSKAAGSKSGSSDKLSLLASIPGRDDTGVSRGFNGNSGTNCQQEPLPGALQIYDVDAITFPFVDVLFHLEVKEYLTLQEGTRQGWAGKERGSAGGASNRRLSNATRGVLLAPPGGDPETSVFLATTAQALVQNLALSRALSLLTLLSPARRLETCQRSTA